MPAIAKITAKGQATIPQNVHAALHVVPGDLITWAVDSEAIATVRRAQSPDLDCLRVIEGTLGERAAPAGQEAYRDF